MRRPGPACVCLLVLIGCSASPPGPGGGDDDDMQVDAAPQPQTDAPPDDVVEPLVLGPLPDSTYWDIVPLHGTGPKNGTILLETDVAGAMTRPTASDGSFCVDIPLRKNATNMIQIRAVDAAGNLSEELTRSVRQQGSPPPPPMGDPARNVSVGGTMAKSVDVDGGDGELYKVIDGNRGSWVGLTNAWTDNDWIQVQLSERSVWDQIHIMSPDDCRMQNYIVWLSDLATPGHPDGGNDDWVFGIEITDGTGDEALVPAMSTFPIRHVGIQFLSKDCGGGIGDGFRGRHKVTEVEVWTPEGTPPPSQQAPSCSGGG